MRQLSVTLPVTMRSARILKAWHSFLDSPASHYEVNREPHGGLSKASWKLKGDLIPTQDDPENGDARRSAAGCKYNVERRRAERKAGRRISRGQRGKSNSGREPGRGARLDSDSLGDVLREAPAWCPFRLQSGDGARILPRPASAPPWHPERRNTRAYRCRGCKAARLPPPDTSTPFPSTARVSAGSTA